MPLTSNRPITKRSLLVIAISLAVAQGVFLLHWFDRYSQSIQNAIAFESNRVEIARLDEVLTMSARVHAAIGDPVWQERYLEHVELLGEIIDQTIDLAESEKVRTAIALVSDANDRLIAMEDRSFALAVDGELEEAFDLLSSTDYQSQKDRYQRGLKEAFEISQLSVGNAVDYHRSVLILGVIVVFLSLFILTELWRRVSSLEQREVAEQVKKTLEQQRQLNNLQRHFASMVSHQFRTPLAIIDGTIHRLERRMEGLTPDHVKQATKKIRATIRRLTSVMESVLNLAHIEEDRLEVVTQAFNLAGLIREVVTGYRHIHPERTINLALDHTPALVMGDSKLLGQVISCLISNALKFSETDRPVDLESYAEGDEVILAVHDRGIGMAPEQIEKIGELFFRTESSAAINGCGVGLYFARHVIALHGGRLEVQSTPRTGSTFTIRLPQKVPAEDQKIAAEHQKGGLVALAS